jgi:upstream activation factor subunit UAF30
MPPKPNTAKPSRAETAQKNMQTPLKISSELANIIGTEENQLVSRPQVTKKLWAYIKEKNLQDPRNGQWFTPDDKMAVIFGPEKIKCFSMAKYLERHFSAAVEEEPGAAVEEPDAAVEEPEAPRWRRILRR